MTISLSPQSKTRTGRTMNTTPLKPVTAPRLGASEIVNHAFFTRSAGVSTGIYAGLNVGIGSGDDPQNVARNRELAARHLGCEPKNLVTLYQTHSADVISVDTPFQGDRPRADGLVTSTPGLLLGILTADCGPVLLADEGANVVGACHAGWKGATGGILEATVEAMIELGAARENVIAVLGPTISQDNYEVGPEFVERLTNLEPGNTRWIRPSTKAGHAMFDLPGYIVSRLQGIGIDASWTGQCTYADEGNFFSYRRTTHRGEPDYGRQISAICLKE